MKRIIALLLIVILCLSCGKKEDNTIKIGAVFELTGNIAEYGKAALNGVLLAVDELNQKDFFKKNKIKIYYEDSENNPTKAISAIQKLIDLERTPIVIGGVSSATTLAMAPIAEKNKVILFSPASSSPELTKQGEYIFRNYPSDTYEAKVLVDYLIKNKIYSISILYENNDYGYGLAKTFADLFQKSGGRVELNEGYLSQTRDFKLYISKLQRTRVQAYYLPGYYQSVGILLKQLKENSDNTRIFSSTGIEDVKLFSIAKTSANGIIYPTPSIDFENPSSAIQLFSVKYKAKYGINPNYPAMLAYDAANIIALAIEKTGNKSTDEIKNELYLIKNFPGITGNTSIDKNGDAEKPFAMKIIENNRFISLEK